MPGTIRIPHSSHPSRDSTFFFLFFTLKYESLFQIAEGAIRVTRLGLSMLLAVKLLTLLQAQSPQSRFSPLGPSLQMAKHTVN